MQNSDFVITIQNSDSMTSLQNCDSHQNNNVISLDPKKKEQRD